MSRFLLAGLCAPLLALSLLAQSAPQASVRSVKVHGSKDAVEIEVEASDRIVPQTQVLTRPDRLVIDFPNAVPSSQVRSQSVDRGEVKDLRVGLFQSKPPVTRVVVDLKSAQSYQVFPYGRTVMIKVRGGGADVSAGAGSFRSEPAQAGSQNTTRPGLVTASYTARSEPVSIVTSDKPLLDVTYRNGLLGIRANKATLSEVLFAVQQRTGAEVSIAAGAEQEKVVADIDPGPAPEVLARLLNGSKFNFLILSAANDPRQLDRVILSVRPESGFAAPLAPVPSAPQNDAAATDAAGDAAADTANAQPANPAPVQAPPQAGGRPTADDAAPNQ
jgi:hypothetical protein